MVCDNRDLRVFDDRECSPKRDAGVLKNELITEQLPETNKTCSQIRLAINGSRVRLHFHTVGQLSPTPPELLIKIVFSQGSSEDMIHTIDNRTTIVPLGRTHCQYTKVITSGEESTLICNPVAVGLPAEVDSETNVGLARYAIVDTIIMECTLRSVQYDPRMLLPSPRRVSHDVR